MKARVLRSFEVSSSLKALLKQVDAVLKRTNEQAANLVRRGDYADAEGWVRVGTLLGEFRKKTLAFREEWKVLCREATGKGLPIAGKPGKKTRQSTTPVWEFYQPILKALVQIGGEARRPDVEPLVFQLMGSRLMPGDLEMAGGERPHWQNSIRRARKPLIKEGWLSEDGSKGMWRITEKGKAAATRQRPSTGTQVEK